MLNASLCEFRRRDFINRCVFQPFETQWVLYEPEDLTHRRPTFCTQECIYVMCMDVRTLSVPITIDNQQD